MSLNVQQIHLIQSAVPTILANADAVAGVFYTQLFALDPALRAMFRGDMTEQGRKLMAMLNVALSNLEKLEALRPALKHLGQRHIGYGVSEAHYAVVGQSLINTLEVMLGEAFTLGARAAWTTFYGDLVQAITVGLYEVEPEPVM